MIHLFLNNAHLTLPPLPSRGTATEKHLLLVARKLKISMRAVWPFFSKKENKEKYKKKKTKIGGSLSHNERPNLEARGLGEKKDQ